MDFSFFNWGYLHVIAVEVGEIGVGVVWRHEVIILEVDGREREHAILAVHDAVTIVDEDIGDICVMRPESESDGPCYACYQVFRSKPYPLGGGA